MHQSQICRGLCHFLISVKNYMFPQSVDKTVDSSPHHTTPHHGTNDTIDDSLPVTKTCHLILTDLVNKKVSRAGIT